MNLPLHLNHGVTVQQIGDYDVISTNFGLEVHYDLVYHVTVTVPTSYAGKTCGLCGNFNGDKNDDFQLPDGKLVKDITTFGAAWKVGLPGVVCEDGCVGDSCPKCPDNEKAKIESECSIITDPKGPFAACHDVLDPASYFRDCVYDVCVAKGGVQMLCHSISAYVIDCQDVGVKIQSWRTPELCRELFCHHVKINVFFFFVCCQNQDFLSTVSTPLSNLPSSSWACGLVHC